MGETTVAGDGVASFETPVDRGTSIDRYVVLERLGAGAMGVVYTAFDPRLDRRVAVKVLNPRAQVAEERLLDEARALAKLSHPNVVGVYDAGRFRDSVFITMERIEGDTLDGWLGAAEDRAWRDVLGVLLGAGRGLAAAHRAGTVHRDFKPKNLMVDPDGRAKVMDFGLAALAGTDAGHGRPQGTPLYMAPELHMGEAASFSSDQYAFCVVAFEALAGRHPRADVSSRGGLLEAISGDPPPLNVPGLPVAVRNAILRGMAPSASARWPSMDALLEVFSAGLRDPRSWKLGAAVVLGLAGVAWAATGSDEGPACPDPSALEAAVVTAERRAEIEQVLATYDRDYGVQRAGLITARIDGYARAWARTEVDACQARHTQPRARARHDATRACLDRVRDEFTGVLDVLADADGVERVRAADVLDGLPAAEGCIDEAVAQRGVVAPPEAVAARVATLRQALAGLRAANAVGRWVQVRDQVVPLLDEAQSLDYPPLVAEALWVQGETFRLLHQIPEAERSLSDAAWMAIEHGDRRLALDAAVSLVALRRDISQTERNRRWAARARRLVEVGSDPSIEAELELHLSVAERNVGSWTAAKAHADAAVEAMRAVHGEEHATYAEARHVLGAALFRMDDLDAALTVARDNLALRERVLGPLHPEVVDSLLLLGVVRAGRNEIAEAEQAYRRALDVQTRVVGPRTRVLAGIANNLVSVLIRQSRLDEAQVMADRAVSIWRELGQNDSLVYGLLSTGGVAFHRGDCRAMREHYGEAWERIEVTGGVHPLRSATATWLAGAHVCLGEFEQARAWLDRVAPGELARPNARVHAVWRALVEDHDGNEALARRHAQAALTSDASVELAQLWWDRVEAIAGR